MPRVGHDRGARGDSRQRAALQSIRVPWFVTPIKTTTYTARYNELVQCNPTGGGFTVTLPTAFGCRDQQVAVKNSSASTNTITIDGNAAETIDGAANITITTARGFLAFISDGTGWLVM